MKANPQLKEAVARELATALEKGFQSAKNKYPLLESLEPRYIIKNEKGLSTYFYKVYKYENGNIGIFGIGIDSKGHIKYKTMYQDDDNQRLNQLLKSDNKKVVYVDNKRLQLNL